MDRERERDDEQILQEAMAIREKHRALVSLDMRVWRHMHPTEYSAYSRLASAHEELRAVPLSVVAKDTSRLIPTAEKPACKQYVKDYATTVSDLAKYAIFVERTRTQVVEAELGQFMSSLSVEHQATARPIYDRLVAALTPATHLPKGRVDTENFAE